MSEHGRRAGCWDRDRQPLHPRRSTSCGRQRASQTALPGHTAAEEPQAPLCRLTQEHTFLRHLSRGWSRQAHRAPLLRARRRKACPLGQGAQARCRPAGWGAAGPGPCPLPHEGASWDPDPGGGQLARSGGVSRRTGTRPHPGESQALTPGWPSGQAPAGQPR